MYRENLYIVFNKPKDKKINFGIHGNGFCGKIKTEF